MDQHCHEFTELFMITLLTRFIHLDNILNRHFCIFPTIKKLKNSEKARSETYEFRQCFFIAYFDTFLNKFL
jgi:hypothetical protein